MNVDVDRVRARLLVMRRMLDHLERLGEITPARLEDEFDLRLQVERILSQVVTLATEINSHVAAREIGRAPADLRSSFADLAEAGWIEPELARGLRDSTSLRNVLVLEYVDIDLDIVAATVPTAIERYGHYIRAVAARL